MASFRLVGGSAVAFRAGLAGLCAAAATILTQFPASAHQHPGGSTDRVTPGAVRVESSASVVITLLDDRAQLKQVTRQYTVPLGVGSGFTVAPEGVIVTATGVVRPAHDPRVYAANRIVSEYFGRDIPGDFGRHQVDDGDVDSRLQNCYPPYGTSSTCLVQVTPAVRVFPNTNPPMNQGLPAAIAETGRTPQAPAILKVTQGSGNTLPTVPMAATIPKNVAAIDLIAYTGRPAANRPPVTQIAHFDPPGSRTIKQEDRARLTALLHQGGDGGALIDDAKSDVIAMMTADGKGRLTATPTEDIRSALTKAGATVRRGPVDVVYETALAHYHTRHYGDAVPVLQQVLKLRPDNAVAAQHLRTAMAKRGTAQDADTKATRPGADNGGTVNWLWPAAGVLVVAAAAAGALFLLRRPEPAGSLLRRFRAEGPPDRPTAAAHAPSEGLRSEPVPHRTPEPSSTGGTRPRRTETAPRRDEPTTRDSVHAPSEAPGRPETGAAGHDERTERFCTSCGMRLGRGHQFCGFCGHPVDL